MRLSTMTWVDLIAASALILGTIVAWKAADATVEYLLDDRAPERDDYLRYFHVRQYELKVEDTLAALGAVRKKWSEDRLAGAATVDGLHSSLLDLERVVIDAEREVADVRRKAGKSFDDANFRFVAFKTALTVSSHAIATLLTFVLVLGTGTLIARVLKLTPNWRTAAIFAGCLLAPVYGFTVAGGFGAAIGALPALRVLMRP